MSSNKILNRQSAADSWETYWQGDQTSHAYSSSGVNHEDVSGYWVEIFEGLAQSDRSLKMLDIASGNGALPELALSTFADESINITAVDISPAAIANIVARMPQVTGVVCDALQLPLANAEYDLVTSQFGLEYAGVEALDTAIPLVAAGGTAVLMLHIEEGLIHQDCLANRDALLALKDCNFIALSKTMFDTGFKAVAGADRKAYDDAAAELALCLEKVEAIIEKYGVDIAGGSVLRLYNDVGTIHSKLPNYSAGDVLPWLDNLHTELSIYADRMQTMLDAAVSRHEFAAMCDKLLAANFTLHDNAVLFDKQTKLPLAWILRAEKD